MVDNDRAFLHIHNYSFYYRLVEKPKYDLNYLIKSFLGGGREGVPVDSTGTITHLLKVQNTFPIPIFSNDMEKSITLIYGNTVKTMVQKNKPIDIFWSGGVDSTSVVAAFLKECKNLDQVRIMLNERSIHEYESFFNKYIKNNLNYKIFDTHLYKEISSSLANNLVVTGHPIGLLLVRKAPFREISKKLSLPKEARGWPWKDIFKTDIPVFANSDQDAFFVEKIQCQLDKAPFVIETFNDLIWWLEFSCKWQCEVWDSFKFSKILNSDKVNNLEPFFKNDDFRYWGLWNYSSNNANIRYSEVSYKAALKKYIYNFNKDEEYYQHKDKSYTDMNSYDAYGNREPLPVYAIDNEYNTYSLDDALTKKNLLKIFENDGDDYKKWIQY